MYHTGMPGQCIWICNVLLQLNNENMAMWPHPSISYMHHTHMYHSTAAILKYIFPHARHNKDQQLSHPFICTYSMP